MELKRRFKDHPLRKTLPTSKSISYWKTEECLRFADQLKIDYSDLVKTKVVKEKTSKLPVSSNPLPKTPISQPTNVGTPMFYKIKAVNGNGSESLIKLINISTVSELKYYLAKDFNQVLPQYQTLVYNGTELCNNLRLNEYFRENSSVTIDIVSKISVLYNTTLGINNIESYDNVLAIELLQQICVKEKWDSSSLQISFNNNDIDTSLLTIGQLGMKNNSVVNIFEVMTNPFDLLDLGGISLSEICESF